MTQRPAILIMQRHLGPLSAFLESSYDIYRFWEGPPVEAAPDIRALIVTSEFELDKDLVERLPNLDLIACFGAGYEGIDVPWCQARGIKVTNGPGINNEDVADHAIGLILTERRRIMQGDRLIRVGDWTPEARHIMPSLSSQTLGIVGLGAIGQSIARRAEALRMKVQWWGPRDKPADWPRTDSLIDLAKTSDVLVIACRADDSNRQMINAEVLSALGPHGLLVNVARGSIVDEEDLIRALKSGHIAAAALDVFETEPTDPARWVDVPNTVLTPHTGGATTESVQAMLMLLIQNLAAHFAGQPLLTPVKA